ncbi:MAG: TRM11 family methyltransferase [Candidatus Paceibacterota bacterium]
MQDFQPITKKLFPTDYQLIDGTDEIFELNFALWEYENLNKKDLIKRSAYFKSVEGEPTIHYQTCNLQNLEDIHRNSSLRTKAFFLNGKYSTGYATHSLFPYRGKFHPQMIRALLNMMGIKPGNVVLDPMSGSATLSVEANLLGIDSVGVDVSPFCCLMGRVKTFALNLNSEKLTQITKEQNKIFEKLNKNKVPHYFIKDSDDENRPYYEVALLAYLDAVGFARRSSKSLSALFPIVLNRYITTIKNFQNAREKLGLKIGKSKIIEDSALKLPLEDNSVDGVITSPPYSFAIDYIDNDRPQLEYLGYVPDKLKEKMIGLQGRGISQKLELYFEMLDKVFRELARVSKKGSKTIFVVGTNDIQTKGVRLETKIKELAEGQKFKFLFEILKPIKGLQNTMKEEYILIFENDK